MNVKVWVSCILYARYMRRLRSFRIKPGSRLLLRMAGLRFLARCVDSRGFAASKFSIFGTSWLCLSCFGPSYHGDVHAYLLRCVCGFVCFFFLVFLYFVDYSTIVSPSFWLVGKCRKRKKIYQKFECYV